MGASASVLPNKLLGNTNAAGPQMLCVVRLTIDTPLGAYRIQRGGPCVEGRALSKMRRVGGSTFGQYLCTAGLESFGELLRDYMESSIRGASWAHGFKE